MKIYLLILANLNRVFSHINQNVISKIVQLKNFDQCLEKNLLKIKNLIMKQLKNIIVFIVKRMITVFNI